MNKALVVLAATATLVATAAAPTNARADGGRITAGVLGGLAAGAIIGSAVAPRPYYYGPPPAYVVPGPVYYDEPACRIVRERVWVEGYGYRTRRVEVCD
jgi:hypothetical protein